MPDIPDDEALFRRVQERLAVDIPDEMSPYVVTAEPDWKARAEKAEATLQAITELIWSQKDPRLMRGEVATAQDVADHLDDLNGQIADLEMSANAVVCSE